MQRFSVRKRFAVNLGGATVYGRNDVKWGNHAIPSALSVYLSAIPNVNLLSIGYASSFCTPDCDMSKLDLSKLSKTLQTNVNRADPFTNVVSSPVTEKY